MLGVPYLAWKDENFQPDCSQKPLTQVIGNA
jgi:hypothetical protein